MPKKKTATPNQIELDPQEFLKTAPCVPVLRQKVRDWRRDGYPGATEVTKQLVRWWFHNDHRLPSGARFTYHASQQEAIETLIYCHEVARARTRHELLETFAHGAADIQLPGDDSFTRYCTKMATGSGKTKVMSMAVVWQYWNAVKHGDDEYARTFLVIAPNVIVLERLRADFAGGRIFQTDPLVPPALRFLGFDLQCVARGDGELPDSEGLLLLTNVQQLYERREQDDDEPEAMRDVLGSQPPATLTVERDFRQRIAARAGRLLVINDEAHHTHDEGSMWNEVIRGLHASTPIVAQLDYSATPRFQKGALFPWTISDYPLRQAIYDRVVKSPYKGVANIPEVNSDIASTRYEGFLTAGVHRWREYRDLLTPLGKRPILFIMLNSTQDANEVGDWLRTKFPEELGGERTLVIHTKGNGEILDRDLDRARQLARDVDGEHSKVNAIVSVLMLREGWDVQNVTVVVGLRPYNAKANILPEQTIGRGLRLMFRSQNAGYLERVDVIGNKAFLEFVSDLEKLEDLKLGDFILGKDKLHLLTIEPVPGKMAHDIAIPQLTPIITRKSSIDAEIAQLDVSTLKHPILPRKLGGEEEKHFTYEAFDFLTLAKEVEREYELPAPRSAGEVIGYLARLIAKDLHLPAQFAALAPKLRQFYATRAFGGPADLDDPLTIQAMARPAAAHVVRTAFDAALRDRIVQPATPRLLTADRRISSVAPFLFSHVSMALKPEKCVLNYAPCSNEFERAFAKFLDGCSDITAWCKVPDSLGFSIEYTDQLANLRLYYPDFVAIADDGSHWVLETKGAETIEVAHKDRAATLWCENASTLTGVDWRYLKVGQKAFADLNAADFADLRMLG